MFYKADCILGKVLYITSVLKECWVCLTKCLLYPVAALQYFLWIHVSTGELSLHESLAGVWCSGKGEAFYWHCECHVQLGVSGFKFQATPRSCQTTTKRALTIMNYLSIVQCSINMKSPAFRPWWGCCWSSAETHTALSVVTLTESSVLAETITGILFCPCMDCIFRWKPEIETSENRHGWCGLSRCLFMNLAAPAPLLLTLCRQTSMNCLYFADWPHRSQAARIETQSRKSRPGFSPVSKFPVKSLFLWWSLLRMGQQK